jgi:hypothetical protein
MANRLTSLIVRARPIFFMLVVALAPAGCGTFQSSDDSAVQSSGDENVVTGLLAITNDYDASFSIPDPKDPSKTPVLIPGLFKQKTPLNDPANNRQLQEDRIGAICSPPRAEGVAVAAAAVSIAADYIVSALGYLAKRQIAKYSVAYTGEATYPFYVKTEKGASGFTPRLALNCLRIVRYDKTKDEVRLDAIVQLRIYEKNSDAVQIRPLRVYFKKGSYVEAEKQKKPTVSVTAALAIDSVWYEKNQGKSQTVFSYQFLPATDFAVSDDKEHDPFKYFNWNKDNKEFSTDWDRVPRMPLPPISVGLASSGPAPVIYRVSAAESGPVPGWLKGAAEVLKAKHDDISKLLGDALKKRAGVDDSSSDSGS